MDAANANNNAAAKEGINKTIIASIVVVALVAFVVREITLSNSDMLAEGQEAIVANPNTFSWDVFDGEDRHIHRDWPNGQANDDAASIGLSFLTRDNRTMFCPIDGEDGYYRVSLRLKGLWFWMQEGWNRPIYYNIFAGLNTVPEDGPYNVYNMTSTPNTMVLTAEKERPSRGGANGTGEEEGPDRGYSRACTDIKRAHIASWVVRLRGDANGGDGRFCHMPFAQVNYYYTMSDADLNRFPVLLLQSQDATLKMRIKKIASLNR